ncbi:MAG: hypothetical protein RRB13_15835 [bacterium]|nr:hypothetical protein [bacterium]
MSKKTLVLVLVSLLASVPAWAYERPSGAVLSAGQTGFNAEASRDSMSQVAVYASTPMDLAFTWEFAADQTKVTFKDADTDAVQETSGTIALGYAGFNHSFALGYHGISSTSDYNKGASGVAFDYLYYEGFNWSAGLHYGRSNYPNFIVDYQEVTTTTRSAPIPGQPPTQTTTTTYEEVTGLTINQVGLTASKSLGLYFGLDLGLDQIMISPAIYGQKATSFSSASAGLRAYWSTFAFNLSTYSGKRFGYLGAHALAMYSNTNIYQSGVAFSTRWTMGPSSALTVAYNQDNYLESESGPTMTGSGLSVALGLSF